MTEKAPVEPDPMSNAQYWHLPRMIIAWVIALGLGLLVIFFGPPESRFSWLAFAIGLSTVATFALQLGTAQREGFITRTSFSVAGSVVIIAVLDLVNVLLPG